MSFHPDMINKLREDFPGEAVDKKEVGAFVQIGYRAQYIIERLNDVFGHDGWRYTVLEEREYDKYAGAKVMLEILHWQGSMGPDGIFAPEFPPKVIAQRTQWGNCNIVKDNIFDAKKGAITNALCKCASMFDIGHLAYKSMLDDPDIVENSSHTQEQKKEPVAKTEKASEAKLEELKDVCEKKGVTTISQMKKILNVTVLKDPKMMSDNEIAEIIKKIKEWQPEQK